MLNSIMNSDFTFSDAEQKKENERTQVGITFVYVTRLAKKVTPKFKGKLDVMDKENNNSLNDEAESVISSIKTKKYAEVAVHLQPVICFWF